MGGYWEYVHWFELVGDPPVGSRSPWLHVLQYNDKCYLYAKRREDYLLATKKLASGQYEVRFGHGKHFTVRQETLKHALHEFHEVLKQAEAQEVTACVFAEEQMTALLHEVVE